MMNFNYLLKMITLLNIKHKLIHINKVQGHLKQIKQELLGEREKEFILIQISIEL